MARTHSNGALYGGAYTESDATRDRRRNVHPAVIEARRSGVTPPVMLGHGPVDRSPAHLKGAVDDAAAAFNADPTAETWATLSTAVQAALDHDDAQRRAVA